MDMCVLNYLAITRKHHNTRLRLIFSLIANDINFDTYYA